MTSFLFISHDQTTSEKKVATFCDDLQIHELDRTIFELSQIETKTAKKSWGIDDIKQLQKKLLLKPLKSKTKAIIIYDADVLTLEAQNALLKVLEEPPQNTIIVLLAKTKEAFLPTILSRCQIIENQLQSKIPSHEDIEKTKLLITTIFNAPIGERLKLAESLSKNKEEALEWIVLATYSLRSQLYKQELNEADIFILRQLQKTHKTIKTTNANLRFTFEQLFLSSRMPQNGV